MQFAADEVAYLHGLVNRAHLEADIIHDRLTQLGVDPPTDAQAEFRLTILYKLLALRERNHDWIINPGEVDVSDWGGFCHVPWIDRPDPVYRGGSVRETDEE